MNTRNLEHGTYAGLLGGVVFGAMMGMMGMLPMIGQMIGRPTVVAGLGVHLVNSAIIGAGFGVVLGSLATGLRRGLTAGLAYGGVWWLLGPLTLMPLFMGMGLGVNWNVASAIAMLPSLVGHLMYGSVLGTSFAWFRQRGGHYVTAAAS